MNPNDIFMDKLVLVDDESTVDRYLRSVSIYTAVLKDEESGNQATWKFALHDEFCVATQFVQAAINKVNDANVDVFYVLLSLTSETLDQFDVSQSQEVLEELHAYDQKCAAELSAFQRRSSMKIVDRDLAATEEDDGGQDIA